MKHRQEKHGASFFFIITGGQVWLIDRIYNSGFMNNLKTEIVAFYSENQPIIDAGLSLGKK